MGEKKFSVKVFETERGRVVALCDYEILGKEFKEQNAILKVSPEFYSGEVVDENEALEIMSTANMLNIVGKQAVELAIRSKLIHPAAVIYVEGVPYAIYINVE
uniref:DUF424 family protein n=1 Tax=Fervidicoccus fontis TaxID=683846 RepID=A0A7J3ZM26_9CREN